MRSSLFIAPYSRILHARTVSQSKTAKKDQKVIFNSLIAQGKRTQFGKDHQFDKIDSYGEYKKRVSIRDYEDLKPYVEQIKDGQKDILWPGLPKYFAKTSGTTSGVKYIPLTKQSMPYHMKMARNAFLNYAHIAKINRVFNGKLIFLSGSPQLEFINGIPFGRLSGIVNHEIPSWIKGNQVPTFETNCIENWEQKLEQIVKETHRQNLTMISGIPPWVQMYFESLLDYTGKSTIKEIFPNFELFIFGGVNYEPYRKKLDALIGERIHTLETYPASEGFIAFQDDIENNGLLLQTQAGIFYEFVSLSEIHKEEPERLSIEDVELNKDYAVIINSNAGLWAYNLGDTVRFVSKDPYKLFVSGRVKHFISAFGEHVIAKEVEEAMINTCQYFNTSIVEFTVAPQVNPENNATPYHEWFVEFDQIPENMDAFTRYLNDNMVEQNIYYRDLIEGNILQNLQLRVLKKDAFREYMDAHGKLGGQNKVPRLSNDRKIADILSKFHLSDDILRKSY